MSKMPKLNEQQIAPSLELAQTDGGYNPDSGLTYKQYLEQGGERGQQLRDQFNASSKKDGGYNPDSGLTYKQYLEQGGEYGQKAREAESASAYTEQPQSQADQRVSAAIPVESAEGTKLRPVREGELTELLQDNPEILNPESDDELKLGAAASMAIEPWTLDTDSPEGKKSNPTEDDVDYYRWQKEHSSEGSIETPPEEPIEPPESVVEEPPEVIEIIKTPELIDAEKQVEIARNELARLKAGRESATFFSIKFSKKKLEAAEEAYAQAKKVAGNLAMDLLLNNGRSIEEVTSAVNYGSFIEEQKLIRAQANIEIKAIESKWLKPFYEWWNKQGTKWLSTGTLNKGAVMLAIGGTVGIGAAIIAAPIVSAFGGAAAAGGAGLAASRAITKGIVGNKIRVNAKAGNVVEAKAKQREQKVKNIIDNMEAQKKAILQEVIDDLSSKQTKDTKRTNDRRAAISMVISAVSAAGAALLFENLTDFAHKDGGIEPPSNPNTPPAIPADYDPTYDRFLGISSGTPDAAQRTITYFESIKPGTPAEPELLRLDEAWNSVKGQVNLSQARVVNGVIGRLSSTAGFGNGWSADNMQRIVDLAKQGMNRNEILESLQAT